MRTPPHAGRTQNFAPCAIAIAIVGLLASLLASLLAAAPAHSRSVSAAKASDRTAAVLALLPADVIFVAGVSVTRLRANPALAAMVIGAGPDSGVARVKKLCRLDPLRQVDSAVLAVGDGWRPALYLATTGVSEAQVVACATALLSASWGTAVETRRDGAQVTLLSAGSSNTRRELVFVLPGVVRIPLGDNDGRKAMPPPATGGGLLHEPNMAAALQQVRMSGLAWGAGLVPGEGETRVVFVAATVELPSASQEPVLDARIRFIAATAARELEETLKREFASAAAGQHPIARLLKRLTTTVEDRDVVVRGPLAVDAELVRELGRMGFGLF